VVIASVLVAIDHFFITERNSPCISSCFCSNLFRAWLGACRRTEGRHHRLLGGVAALSAVFAALTLARAFFQVFWKATTYHLSPRKEPSWFL